MITQQAAPSEREGVERLWQSHLDLDDRTSPEEYPEMALITYEEFAAVYEAGRDAALSQEPAAPSERERAMREALEPFATFEVSSEYADDAVILGDTPQNGVTFGDFRAAARALSQDPTKDTNA